MTQRENESKYIYYIQHTYKNIYLLYKITRCNSAYIIPFDFILFWGFLSLLWWERYIFKQKLTLNGIQHRREGPMLFENGFEGKSANLTQWIHLPVATHVEDRFKVCNNIIISTATSTLVEETKKWNMFSLLVWTCEQIIRNSKP